jgi:phosphopantetheine adenylyltransferase
MTAFICLLNSLTILGAIYFIFLVINKAKKRFQDIDERMKMIEQEFLAIYKEWKTMQGKKDVLLCKNSKKSKL